MASALHGDVALAIGHQVEQMILQARKDSETRVRHDLAIAKVQLEHMEGLMTDLRERVNRCGGPTVSDPVQTVDRVFLSQKISQLEQKWGSEVKALKQDLHRTILAHNHNSDLMRHHRDALDEARRKLDSQTQPRAEQVDAQIEKVDRLLRVEKSKQRALDALTERLAALEQQVGEMLPNASMTAPFPGMLPGLAGMNPMLAAAGLGGAREAAAAAAAAAASGAGGKRASKKDSEQPTEEEVRARLLQAAGDAGVQFNAEAPVFVPRGADTAVEAKQEADGSDDDDADSSGGGEGGSAQGEAFTA